METSHGFNGEIPGAFRYLWIKIRSALRRLHASSCLFNHSMVFADVDDLDGGLKLLLETWLAGDIVQIKKDKTNLFDIVKQFCGWVSWKVR